MKKTIFFLLGLACFQLNFGQSLCRIVIASAGTVYATQNNVSLSWTFGEAIVSRVSNGNNMLTQGFQQPEVCNSITNTTQPSFKGDILVFPSPTSGLIHLQFQATSNLIQAIEIADQTGKKLIFRTILPGEMETTFDLSPYSDGIYHLNLLNSNQTLLKSFKVVKAN